MRWHITTWGDKALNVMTWVIMVCMCLVVVSCTAGVVRWGFGLS